MFEKIKQIFENKPDETREELNNLNKELVESNEKLKKKIRDLEKERKSHILSYLDDNSGYVRIGNRLVFVTVTRVDHEVFDFYRVECTGSYRAESEEL